VLKKLRPASHVVALTKQFKHFSDKVLLMTEFLSEVALEKKLKIFLFLKSKGFGEKEIAEI
jgi:hypothetical protein